MHWHWTVGLTHGIASHDITCVWLCVCVCAVRSHYVTPASVGNNNLTEHSLCASVCAQVIYASLGPNKLAYCPTEMIYHWPPGHCQYFPCALPQWNWSHTSPIEGRSHRFLGIPTPKWENQMCFRKINFQKFFFAKFSQFFITCAISLDRSDVQFV